MACVPAVICYTPTQATTMANNTATSLESIHSTPAGWTTGSNYVGCVMSNDTQYSMGIRFSAVPIPQGSTINSAYLVVTSSGNYIQDTVSAIIQGEDVDSAAVFAGTYADYNGRTKTSATVSWFGVEHWTIGSEYVSPNISTVVSEVVNRAGWVTGNNMVLFWDDRAKMSSQSDYMPANVRGGSVYKLVVDYTAATTVTNANVTTKDASTIGSGSAALNAYIDSDGNDPNNVAVRFGYSNVSTALFSNYLWFTSWSSANYSTGEVYAASASPLLPSSTYYYNTQAQNSVGYTYGVEQVFITPGASTTVSPSNFILLPLTTSVDIQWTKPSGYSNSRLYFKVGGVPSSNITGTLLYSGDETQYTHTGLTSGTTYGYLLYGYEGGSWSLATSGTVTTKGTSTSTALSTPTTPTNWFISTDYTRQNQTFVYPIVNNIADSLAMPRNTAWVTWALAVCMFLGFLIWSASRSMVATTLAVCVGVLIGSAQGLIPNIMSLFIIVFGFAVIAVRERL